MIFLLAQASPGALKALGLLIRRNAAFVALLYPSLSDSHALVRHGALTALEELERPSVEQLRRVFALLGDEDDEVSHAAASVVYPYVRHLQGASVPVLLSGVRSDDDRVRETVVCAFDNLKWRAGSAIPTLEALREHPSQKIQETAAVALEVIRGLRRIDARGVVFRH